MKPTAISIAVVQHQGRFLIGRRPPGKPLAGLWEFPGGKILPGETPEQAAVRECREETGVDALVVAPFPDVVHHYDHGPVHLYFFSCSPVDPVAEPLAPFRWVEVVDLRRYEFPEANSRLLDFLAEDYAT